jgi:uncharacterized protein (DUF849 family)
MRGAPLFIEVGLNEATERSVHPRVPFSPEEIAADVLECAAAGASIVHFHARDPVTGEQRLADTELYRDAMRRVRRANRDVQLVPTYSPFPPASADALGERFGHVLALASDPEVGSRVVPLDMGSLNLVSFDGERVDARALAMPLGYAVYASPVPLLAATLREYDARGLVATLAVFEPGHLRAALALRASGYGRRALIKFFLSGSWIHGPLPDPEGLADYLRLLRALDPGAELAWFCAPSGIDDPAAVERLLRAAIAAGGHVRVGIGDTPRAARGRSNRALVEEVVRIAAELGREVAGPRELLARFA